MKNSILQEQVVKVDGVAEARRFFNYTYAAVTGTLLNAVYHKGKMGRPKAKMGIRPRPHHDGDAGGFSML